MVTKNANPNELVQRIYGVITIRCTIIFASAQIFLSRKCPIQPLQILLLQMLLQLLQRFQKGSIVAQIILVEKSKKLWSWLLP